MKRIWHPYHLWEDFHNNFYGNCSGIKKEQKIQYSIKMFNNEHLTKEMMSFVVENWKYSCEHNLSNTSLNRIAWLGQAACAAYQKIPHVITMEAWNLLSKEVQDRSDKIAQELIYKWELHNKDLICLNID